MRLARAMRIYREEQVYSALRTHAASTIKAVELIDRAVDMIIKNEKDNLVRCMDDIFRLKKEADLFMRGEVRKLSSSKFSPENRADLLEMMLAAEKIIAEVETLAYTIKMLSLADIDVGGLPESVERGMKKMSEKIVEETRLLEKALLKVADDPDQAAELCNAAADIENIVDDLYFDTMVELMKEGKSYNPARFFLIRELVLGLEEVADRGEDLADRVRIIIAERT